MLKEIIRKFLKWHKIRLAYNTITMKQEVVLEYLEHVSVMMIFQSLGHLKKHIRNKSQREIITSCDLRN